jgi:hypothetical protein
LDGEEDSPNNYNAHFGTGDGTADRSTAPRHRHVFDQVRFVMEGEYSIKSGEYHSGTYVMFHPEGAFYGPVEMSPDVTEFTVQFGGASGTGFPSPAQRRKGAEALAQLPGRLEGGKYIWFDDEGNQHNQDGAEALYEQITGRPIVYPPSRYNEAFVMRPENFAWEPDPDQPGVARKRLGTFTERDTRIGFIKLDAGASFSFGTEPAPEILFVTMGSLSLDGETLPRLTAFATTADESPSTLTAVEPTEAYYLKLPTF